MSADAWLLAGVAFLGVTAVIFMAGACRLSGEADDAMALIVGDLPCIPQSPFYDRPFTPDEAHDHAA